MTKNAGSDGARNPLRAISNGWRLAAITLTLLVAALAIWLRPGGAPEANADVVDQIIAEVIPQEGDATSYGLPLSLANTQRFIGYYNEIELTPAQAQIKADALNALKAPCCDDNTMEFC